MTSSVDKCTEVSALDAIILRKQWENLEQVGPHSPCGQRPTQRKVVAMIQKADSQQIKLPDRKEITLCEAVTTFAYGKASDALHYMVYDETEITEEQSAKAKDLIERLHEAAYAGRVKLRALKNGDNHADGHKLIDRLYFSEPRGLRWEIDEIWVRGLSPEHPKFESHRSFTWDWRDVHLDREDFEALLQAMGVSVQHGPDADVPGDQTIYTTGLVGRPTSIHLVLLMARDRLDAGDYPDTQKTFSEQLAADFAKAEPRAPRMSPKAIRNNAEFRELWRRRKPPPTIIDRS
jgi:hypothetical protein